MSSISFTRNAANLEHILSKGAMIPIFGSIPAVVKIALGAIQAVCALLAMIVALPFICSETGSRALAMGKSHFINGIANIIAGALEAIPLLGTIIGAARLLRADSGSAVKERIVTGQEPLILIGYRDLEESPLGQIGGTWGDFAPALSGKKAMFRISPLLSV